MMDVEIDIYMDQVYVIWDSGIAHPEIKTHQGDDNGWMNLFWEWEIVHQVRSNKGWMFFLRGWHKRENKGRQIRIIAFGNYCNGEVVAC